MTDSAKTRQSEGLPAEITRSLVWLWTKYAGQPPTGARTEIRGNVVTCVLADGVGDFNRSMIVRGEEGPTSAEYKSDAVAAIGKATRQRVEAFLSSHDGETDVATEVFTLEPSLDRGAPALADRRRIKGFRLSRTGVA
jgi:hypothetical protein